MRAGLLRSCLWMLLMLWAHAHGATYSDPDAAATMAAARNALPSAKVLDIIGIERGIDSTLADLGAKVTGNEIRIELSADVLFDFDKYALRPEAYDGLRKVAVVLKEYPLSPARIAGHTDSKGTHAYNQTLSLNRALAIKQWLVAQAGVDAARLATEAFAETKPVAPNTKPDGSDDPEGRRKNRRVEITLRKN